MGLVSEYFKARKEGKATARKRTGEYMAKGMSHGQAKKAMRARGMNDLIEKANSIEKNPVYKAKNKREIAARRKKNQAYIKKHSRKGGY